MNFLQLTFRFTIFIKTFLSIYILRFMLTIVKQTLLDFCFFCQLQNNLYLTPGHRQTRRAAGTCRCSIPSLTNSSTLTHVFRHTRYSIRSYESNDLNSHHQPIEAGQMFQDKIPLCIIGEEPYLRAMRIESRRQRMVSTTAFTPLMREIQVQSIPESRRQPAAADRGR